MCDFCVCNQKWGNLCWPAELRREELKMEGSSRWCCKAAGGKGWVVGSFLAAGVLLELERWVSVGIWEQKWRCLEVLFKKKKFLVVKKLCESTRGIYLFPASVIANMFFLNAPPSVFSLLQKSCLLFYKANKSRMEKGTPPSNWEAKWKWDHACVLQRLGKKKAAN